MNRNLGIYVHIPFCISKCYYCNFTSYASKEEYIEKYIDSLCMEIMYKSDIILNSNITSIYIGGGTPSYIDSKYIVKILDTIRLCSHNNFDDNLSITIEVNPGTITREKAIMYKEAGINRVSIGLQSTHDSILKAIGRKHTYNDFLDALSIFRSLDITNISCDLMYPLPGLSLEMLNNTLDTICKLDIKHVSVYNLEVYEGSKLDFLLKEGFASLVDEDTEYKMKNSIEEKLNKNGLIKYEISNYAKAGYEAQHNTMYWNQGEYLGFGVSASSFLNSTRYTNTASLDDYIEYYIQNNTSINVISEIEELDYKQLMNEYVILKLRLAEGVNLLEFKKKFNTEFIKEYKDIVQNNIEKGLLIAHETNVCLTKKGTEIANIVWQDFI